MAEIGGDIVKLKKKPKLSDVVFKELERLRQASKDGVLHPEAVVRAAEPEKSPLHRFFTWDDTEAARKQRLMEARHLIRVTVTVLPGTTEPVRAFVSLRADRPKAKRGQVTGGGGFRTTESVMSDDEMRELLLQDALAEMQNFQRKYRTLSELASVFHVMASESRRLSKGLRGRGRARAKKPVLR
mgnify:CR=1 FL=1